MKNFKQYVESRMVSTSSLQPKGGVIAHLHHLGQIQSIIEEKERRIRELVEKSETSLKALATIKINLQRALKDRSKLNDAVYKSINIARELTPYTKDFGVSSVIDPPLEDYEKTL